MEMPNPNHLSIFRRRGSVLILVVVVVVLLALLGTALLSSSRGDRFTAQQHTYNTQVDILIESLKSVSQGAIDKGLFGKDPTNALTTTAVFRPPTETANAATALDYHNYDAIHLEAPGSANYWNFADTWLSPRAPMLSAAQPIAVGSVYTGAWASIGTFLVGSSFESPVVWNSMTGAIATGINPKFTSNISTMTDLFEPTFHKLDTDGKNYPAYRRTLGAVDYFFMAGDADGDGIADSGMFRVPVGQIDGVDYFAAVRIVDAASQVNLNTAGSRSGDFALGAQPTQAGITDATTNAALALAAADFADNLGWFQSHVGLEEMLNRNNTFTPNAPFATPFTRAGAGAWDTEQSAFGEMLALNRYRLGYPNTQTANIFARSDMHQDAGQLDGTPPYMASNAFAGIYPDATFLTQGDALDHQLAYRMRNPGLGRRSDGMVVNFGSLSISNAIALAYHGGLMINPDAGKSPIESIFATEARALVPAIPAAMPDSIYSSAANFKDNNTPIKNGLATGDKGYGANQAQRWLMDYYNSDATAGRNIHDAFTGGSPLSNYPNSVPATAFPTFSSARPFVTTWNPVSNQVPLLPPPANPAPPAAQLAALPPILLGAPNSLSYRTAQSKVSVNTADFKDLWLAFWGAMSDSPANDFSPFGAYAAPASLDELYLGMQFSQVAVAPAYAALAVNNPQRMFRNSIRDFHTAAPFTYFDSTNQIALRAAIAAVQTLQLRQDMTAAGKVAALPVYQDIQLQANGTPMNVRVFGTKPQPFISEVYIQTDVDYDPPTMGGGNQNPEGYAAIELYNPFDVAVTLDNTYDLVVCSREDVGAYPVLAYANGADPGTAAAPAVNYWDEPVPLTLPAGGLVIPAHGYALIENLNAPQNNNGGAAANNAALHRPPSSGLPLDGMAGMLPAAQVAQADLSVAYNREIMLRHRVANVGEPRDYYAVDSFFMEIGAPPLTGNAHSFHYCRASGTANNNNWRCVYPGRFVGFQQGGNLYRQQGEDNIQFASDMTGAADNDPWAAAPPAPDVQLGLADPATSWQNAVGPVRSTFTIPLCGSTDSPGPTNANGMAGANTFPFGAFARDGDILQIPYIGAYTVQQANGAGFIEMNSVSMDSAFAEDSYLDDDEQDNTAVGAGGSTKNLANTLPILSESIGRFCPVSADAPAGSNVNDFDLSSNYAGTWRYRWATRLFDYLTVESPAGDFLPNVDGTAAGLVANPPLAVDNDSDNYGNGKANDPTAIIPPSPVHYNNEDIEPRQGLININTAPWQVLAALPMMKTGNNNTLTIATGVWAPGADVNPDMQVDDNVKLAKEIVRYRDGDPAHAVAAQGPFHTLYDLYNVPAFAGANALLMDPPGPLGPMGHGPNASQGDFAPFITGAAADPANDWARFDYKEQFLLLTKISNLITVRSDSFVVYIEVQGWRNLGTTKPELAVQRHVAFIQDRWKRTKSSPINAAVPIPND